MFFNKKIFDYVHTINKGEFFEGKPSTIKNYLMKKLKREDQIKSKHHIFHFHKVKLLIFVETIFKTFRIKFYFVIFYSA